ncbi:MAG: site-specific integrase [Eubacterium sp.]|nr:site-specific integrase [Eubacterium sp.]
MARRGENIYKRKDGRWEGRYKNGFKSDGKTKYSSVYGKSYAEVRSALVEKRVRVQTEAPVCRLKFGEIIQMWLKSLKNTVKESTYANYLMKIEKHILSRLGGISYDKLTAEILNNFVSERLESGLSAKYVSDISVLIKSAAKFAHRQFGYADKAEFMSLPKKEKSAEKRILNNAEQNILTSNLMENISPNNAGILLSAATGMRIGELCALKWSDFDFEKSTVTVSKTMQRIKNRDGNGTKIIVTSPKSHTSFREIPIPEFLKNTLAEMRTNADDFVLSGNSKFVEPHTMQYRFRNILKRLNLPQVNFHSLRHMFATKCVSLEIDVKTLSEILGHSSVKITLDRYVHSTMERKQSCMKLFSDNFLAA